MFRKVSLVACACLLLMGFLVYYSGTARAATCSGYGCDGKDPAQTGCNVGAVHLGIISNTWEDQQDYNDNQVWWSNVCSSNFGFVNSSTGAYLSVVAIFRSDQSNVNCNVLNNGVSPCTVNGYSCYGIGGCDTPTTGGNALIYVAGGGSGFLYMNTNTKTWETDLLYAPSQRVQVCQIVPNTEGYYCSAWH